MATLPVDTTKIIEQFGPHLSRASGQRLNPGVEPWMDFPFNQGKLCPKGVKRYLQGAHPDRLLTAYRRDPAAASGFSPMPYAEAIQRVAGEIARVQSQHGRDA